MIVKAGGRTADDVPTADVRRIERILLKSLHCTDSIARLNAGAYVVLLSGASEANANAVMERIDRAFHSAYPRSKAYLDCRIYPLTAAVTVGRG